MNPIGRRLRNNRCPPNFQASQHAKNHTTHFREETKKAPIPYFTKLEPGCERSAENRVTT
jgi:hypothetical protein